jgi:hypothetical protein
VSADGWLLSGHRRHVAAQLAGLTEVPCRVHPIRRDTDADGFVRLLREFNRQRVKSFAEIAREEIMSGAEENKATAVFEYRRDRAAVKVQTMSLRECRDRKRVSSAKIPMLEAIGRVLEDRKAFWPLSDRQIHYALLNDPPLRHASKPDSLYGNNAKSYKDLTDLLTRSRLLGWIPMSAIADPTRPITLWSVHPDPSAFLQEQLDGFLKGYWRDLMQSQPNHIETMVEKNTIESIVRPIASEYTIPLTSGRGYASLSPRQEMAERFLRSGKESLILLMMCDLDPDGEEIAHSFAQSMRDDFDIGKIVPVKVALTMDQIKKFNLPPMLKAKKKSSNYNRFKDAYGDDVWELESLDPADLQTILREHIEGVLDREAFTHETEQEAKDVAKLDALRRQTQRLLADVSID